ncbi:MAG TPA: hypothetical protein VMU37_01460 [Caulobacteraceae bacterium]|nr:hypothetical protein [Caulobacteraceae bacterium]
MPHAISHADLRKSFANAMSHPSEDIARTILAQAGVDPGRLAKSISTETGLVAFDLQAPAKNLYPTATPLRNRVPRVSGGTGVATNWRQVSSIIGSGYDAIGWVAEGQRAGQMSYTTATKSASYVTIGEEDAATFEAINAAVGFEDIQATMAMRLLQKTMLKEEMAILAGNNSLALGTPATPSLAAAGSGATLPAATYSVIVVALTLEGYRNSSLSGGLATTKTITGADGKTFTVNGGSSNKSANATQAVTLGQTLSATVTPIQGAVAYAWFVGTVGNESLQAITTINSATFAAALFTGQQVATAITADCSSNSLGYDGLLTTALKSSNNAYVNVLPTGTAGAGSTLTASGRGSVVEIDTMLEAMWDNYEVSPTVLFVNSQQLNNITQKVLSSGTAPLLQYRQDTDGGGYQLDAGGTIATYYNPFLLDGGLRIPVKIHPFVPPGTILAYAETLPAQYQSSEVPNVAEMKCRQDYYAIDWPPVTRQRQKGVYVEEVLAVYAPFAMGVITNIGNG